MLPEYKLESVLTEADIERILAAITDPQEKAEKAALLRVLGQLGSGSNKARLLTEPKADNGMDGA